MTSTFVSRSVWNENPVVYFVFKRGYSVLVTPLFFFAHYCVLKKSPRNFESLKWFLYFHVFCTTIEWFCGFFLIDIFDFEPSIVLRIDGVLKFFIDPVLLYRIFCVVEDVSSISALFLFCNRLLIIVNMSRRHKSALRQFVELLLYSLALLFCLWSLPFTISSVPDDQKNAKQVILTTFQNEQFYPDCLLDPTAIVVSDPHATSEDFTAEIEIASWLVIGLAIIVSAKISYSLLERRTKNNMSETTKKMHRKFSQRTIFQALIYVAFAAVPFTMLYLSILLRVRIYALAYLIDFVSENHPTACIVSIFLFYDPYQQFLLRFLKFRITKKTTSKLSNQDRTTITKI